MYPHPYLWFLSPCWTSLFSLPFQNLPQSPLDLFFGRQNFQCFRFTYCISPQTPGLSLNLRTAALLQPSPTAQVSQDWELPWYPYSTLKLPALSPFLCANHLRLLILLISPLSPHCCHQSTSRPLLPNIEDFIIFFLYPGLDITLSDYQSLHCWPNQFPSLLVPRILCFQSLPPPPYFSLQVPWPHLGPRPCHSTEVPHLR